VLAKHRREIEAAYVVRKHTPEGEPPLHVVGVLRRGAFWKLETGKGIRQLIDRLATESRVNEEILFISLNGEQKTFIKPFKKVAGSRLI